MSTNGMESWAVDLKDIAAIYPFQGTEVALVIAGVIFWLWFHVVQARIEAKELDESTHDFDESHTKKSIDRY